MLLINYLLYGAINAKLSILYTLYSSHIMIAQQSKLILYVVCVCVFFMIQNYG